MLFENLMCAFKCQTMILTFFFVIIIRFIKDKEKLSRNKTYLGKLMFIVSPIYSILIMSRVFSGYKCGFAYNLFYGIINFWTWPALAYFYIRAAIPLGKKGDMLDKITNIDNYNSLLADAGRWLKKPTGLLSIILINIDRLKDINLLYGRGCGDDAIRAIAESIKTSIKSYGKLYRLSGDNFCIVAINERFKLMEIVSEKIRLHISDKNIIIDNNKIRLSVSIGGYHGPKSSKSISDYIEMAQDSLRNSKFLGRNTVLLINGLLPKYKSLK